MSEDPVIRPRAGRERPLWACQSWLQAEALEALAELNEQCLELLCEQAVARAARPRPALLVQLESLWSGLDTGARRRAAHCPFLLLEAGFTGSARRPWLQGSHVNDREWRPPAAVYFTAPRTIPVTRLVLAYAWHLARSEPAAARLFLGMTERCADLVAARSLRQVIQIAESEQGLLKPRWAERVHVWRDLLTAAKGGEATALERFHIRGVQLLAADARASDQAGD